MNFTETNNKNKSINSLILPNRFIRIILGKQSNKSVTKRN